MTIVHCIYKYMIRLNDIDSDSTYMYAQPNAQLRL